MGYGDPKDGRKGLGRKLREARTRVLKMTQAEASAHSGIRYSSYINAEAGNMGLRVQRQVEAYLTQVKGKRR